MMKKFVSYLLVFAFIFLASCSANLESDTVTRPHPTEETAENKAKDPKEDGELNVFFVSNSTCYYFTDELYGMLAAAGYENVTLGLVYDSGCSLEKHYDRLQKNEAAYQFRVVDKRGVSMTPGYSLKAALATKNWDVISFDNNARSFSSGDTETSLSNAEPYFGKIYAYISDQFPDARFLWHEVWANEVGYNLAFEMKTVEQRTRVYEAKRGVMHRMMETYGVEGVPTGDAWEKVRDLPLITTPPESLPEAKRFTLCSRLSKGEFLDDFTHDGDIGGGQYLNACVWFEILTGESCVGNTFRPVYKTERADLSLTEEKITLFQNTAHEAVTKHKENR